MGRLGIWGTGSVLPPFPLLGWLAAAPQTIHSSLPAVMMLTVHLTTPPYLPFPPFLSLCQNGSTPLGMAAGKGHTEVVKALLAAGAGTDIADKVSRWLAAPSAGAGKQGCVRGRWQRE